MNIENEEIHRNSRVPRLWSVLGGEIRIVAKNAISEDDIWTDPSADVWRAERFEGSPSFYPVYREGVHYSFSPLPLIARKGHLKVNPEFMACYTGEPNYFYSGAATIDSDIVRIGGPIRFSGDLKTAEAVAAHIAEAMKADIRAVEERHHGYTNVILCGGKDSLNLLLLPWKNPVLVLSAAPNFTLVEEFVRSNGLPWVVEELVDEEDEQVLRAETVANACFMSLVHARWGAHLTSVSGRLNGRAVFWLGQVADAFTTPYWRTYKHAAKAGTVTARLLRVLRLEELVAQTPEDFAEALWKRAAMWQGVSMHIVRMLTGCIVLSAYHGPQMRSVLPRINLKTAIRHDIRARIGELLCGSSVRYPSTNPGPLPSSFRRGLNAPHRFLREAGAFFPIEMPR